MVERVLVIPRTHVPGGAEFHGIRPAGAATMQELARVVAAHGGFMDRPDAEEDPTHKQLIPYVVVRDRDRIFLTERTSAGGDARLHGKASIGVGGHLNPVDEGENPLADGLQREWDEELEADWAPDFQLVGLLNDDGDPVGAVHLGVVFTVEANGRSVTVREHDKLVGRWVSVDQLREAWDRLEGWSQLVASHLFRL